MSSYSPEELDAAREAAQAAVDTAASYDYSAPEEKVEAKLREGLDAAGVTVSDDEFARLVSEIDALKKDEDAGTPTVQAAEPRQNG